MLLAWSTVFEKSNTDAANTTIFSANQIADIFLVKFWFKLNDLSDVQWKWENQVYLRFDCPLHTSFKKAKFF